MSMNGCLSLCQPCPVCTLPFAQCQLGSVPAPHGAVKDKWLLIMDGWIDAAHLIEFVPFALSTDFNSLKFSHVIFLLNRYGTLFSFFFSSYFCKGYSCLCNMSVGSAPQHNNGNCTERYVYIVIVVLSLVVFDYCGQRCNSVLYLFVLHHFNRILILFIFIYLI